MGYESSVQITNIILDCRKVGSVGSTRMQILSAGLRIENPCEFHVSLATVHLVTLMSGYYMRTKVTGQMCSCNGDVLGVRVDLRSISHRRVG